MPEPAVCQICVRIGTMKRPHTGEATHAFTQPVVGHGHVLRCVIDVPDGTLDVAQPAVAALDVWHVAVVQPPVQGRVAVEQLRQVVVPLVGDDEQRATPMTVAHQSEEQARFGRSIGRDATRDNDRQGPWTDIQPIPGIC